MSSKIQSKNLGDFVPDLVTETKDANSKKFFSKRNIIGTSVLMALAASVALLAV